MTTKSIKGYRISKSGKIEKIPGFGLDASQKIKQRTSKKVRVVKKGKA
ncbi:hypothetical protein HYPP_01504 [Hyphomicrobium sp. ghe19]|nr:hypothetical protein HYPP_01504 [Hyphomicrobium sp. ghe19]